MVRTIVMNTIVNPVTRARFQPQVGARTVRASSANSNYESLQLDLKRRFSGTPVGQVQLEGSYTYSHFLDDVSDVFGFDSTPTSFHSLPHLSRATRHLHYANTH